MSPRRFLRGEGSPRSGCECEQLRVRVRVRGRGVILRFASASAVASARKFGGSARRRVPAKVLRGAGVTASKTARKTCEERRSFSKNRQPIVLYIIH